MFAHAEAVWSTVEVCWAEGRPSWPSLAVDAVVASPAPVLVPFLPCAVVKLVLLVVEHFEHATVLAVERS